MNTQAQSDTQAQTEQIGKLNLIKISALQKKTLFKE